MAAQTLEFSSAFIHTHMHWSALQGWHHSTIQEAAHSPQSPQTEATNDLEWRPAGKLEENLLSHSPSDQTRLGLGQHISKIAVSGLMGDTSSTTSHNLPAEVASNRVHLLLWVDSGLDTLLRTDMLSTFT